MEAKPFLNEFNQLKEYYNFRKRFEKDRNNITKRNKTIKDEYYLIDKNWINKWKEYIGYNKFDALGINREINNEDYITFKACLPENIKNNNLPPLDNSKIYNDNGQINPFAEFVIINKICLQLFAETRKNIANNILEISVPLKFLKNKIILTICDHIRLICFKNNKNNVDEEIIFIFLDQNNKNNILSEIEKANIKDWLRDRNFYMDGPDQLLIEEQGCQIKIINKNLKLKLEKEQSVQNSQFQNNQQNFMFNNISNQFNNIMMDVNNQMNNLNLKNRIGVNPMMQNNNMNFNNNMYINNSNFPNNANFMKQNIVNPNQNQAHFNNNNININQNVMNQNNNPIQNDFIKNLIFPHKAGLKNLGKTSYLNSAIECLSNIKSLSKKILYNYGNYDTYNQPLLSAYSNLLYELFNTKETSIEPNTFKQIIGQLNPLFKGEQASDVQVLLLFLIETLDKELHLNKINNNFGNNFFRKSINSTNEQIMLEYFLNEYNSKQTFVSDIFCGIHRSIMKCCECNITKYSFTKFSLLIFYLKKVKNYKINKLGQDQNLNLNLYDAFLCAQEEEKNEGENKIFCNTCNKQTVGTNKSDIYGMPRILIILLNRGKNNQDFNEEFKFDEYLDFTDKNIIINQNSFKKYYLSGIITHLGKSGNEGHFIAYCRNDMNSNFTSYDDETVTEVSIETAMKTQISINENEKVTPYILIYHYIN